MCCCCCDGSTPLHGKWLGRGMEILDDLSCHALRPGHLHRIVRSGLETPRRRPTWRCSPQPHVQRLFHAGYVRGSPGMGRGRVGSPRGKADIPRARFCLRGGGRRRIGHGHDADRSGFTSAGRNRICRHISMFSPCRFACHVVRFRRTQDRGVVGYGWPRGSLRGIVPHVERRIEHGTGAPARPCKGRGGTCRRDEMRLKA